MGAWLRQCVYNHIHAPRLSAACICQPTSLRRISVLAALCVHIHSRYIWSVTMDFVNRGHRLLSHSRQSLLQIIVSPTLNRDTHCLGRRIQAQTGTHQINNIWFQIRAPGDNVQGVRNFRCEKKATRMRGIKFDTAVPEVSRVPFAPCPYPRLKNRPKMNGNWPSGTCPTAFYQMLLKIENTLIWADSFVSRHWTVWSHHAQ